jgi:hypothetical protein
MRHVAPRPVFLDRTGRRRRIVLLTGVGLATMLASGLVVLVIGLSGGSGWHVPGFPDANNAVTGVDVGSNPTPATAPQPSSGSESTSPAVETVAPGSTPEPSLTRRVPTQTPSHPPKPTKT